MTKTQSSNLKLSKQSAAKRRREIEQIYLIQSHIARCAFDRSDKSPLARQYLQRDLDISWADHQRNLALLESQYTEVVVKSHSESKSLMSKLTGCFLHPVNFITASLRLNRVS